jgi:hypothetical protein
MYNATIEISKERQTSLIVIKLLPGSCRNSKIADGTVWVWPGIFDTKVIVAPNSPIDFAKPKTAPVIKAGMTSGKVIVRKIINLFAPNE